MRDLRTQKNAVFFDRDEMHSLAWQNNSVWNFNNEFNWKLRSIKAFPGKDVYEVFESLHCRVE